MWSLASFAVCENKNEVSSVVIDYFFYKDVYLTC